MPPGPEDSGWQSPFAEPEPDEQAVRAKKVRNGLLVLAVVAAFAFAAGWNPPTNTVHSFTKASDYKPDRESGCTNSGKGCHDAEKTYKDFNAYHPQAKCTTCHEYQGVGCIPCHMPKEKECQLCHDGTMEQARDVVPLGGSYPRGHYRETTHTAMGTEMTDRMRGGEDGKASATCGDCHSRDLVKSHKEVPAASGSPYGTSVGCGECHNDVRANGLAEVLSKWKKRGCADCHKTGSSAPQHAIDIATPVDSKSSLDCGATGAGCHDIIDLHAMHKDKPKRCAGSAAEGEEGCHVIGSEAAKPTGVTCGGTENEACHRLYENGAYSHERDTKVHSPQGGIAEDTSFWGTPCGGCHRMRDNGTSLVDEHALATSRRSEDPGNVCTNCHNNDASVEVVKDGWIDRDSGAACSACHGAEDLPAAHEGDPAAQHEVTSAGCSDSGAGCHPTNDLMEVGKPTVTNNIHADCLRCHDWTESDGNLSYDPDSKTCGEGRDCHGASGAYDPASAVHDGDGGRADGKDGKHHRAGRTQRRAEYRDAASGVSVRCGACHSMTLGVEHDRLGSSLRSGSGTACTRCHNADMAAASVVKASWPAKNTRTACESCHTPGGDRAIHRSIGRSHVATELAANGTPAPGSCVRSGCHASLDLRVLHGGAGCTVVGCHANSGDIFGRDIRSCGGLSMQTGCHAGYSANQHFNEHAADASGVVKGVHYATGENVGCFGCHVADLRVEHDNARRAGVLEGGGPNSCAICHAETNGAGDFASLPAVTRAIADHDMRCSTCHASGSRHDGSQAVASAHKEVSTDTMLSAGSVWSDPAEDWKAAFDSPTGGGHNGLSFRLVGGAVDKAFPVTRFSIEDTTYVWALPPNSGATAWLKASAFEPGATATDESIQRIRVECDDCHSLTPAMNGPHGSAVPIAIDPAYSQTRYANPTRDESQFEATGTRRVVCFKCHQVYVGGVDGTSTPGGAALHARHVDHPDLSEQSDHRHGEACVDCHVRIPHAWRRPRLLIRTVATTDGATPDTFPYVREGHDGLLGIRLRSFDPQTRLRSGSCVTGGCHPSSSPTRHPRPSDVPTTAYWP